MDEGGLENKAPAERRYSQALIEMGHCYERLVRGFSILRQIDTIDDPNLGFGEVCLGLLEALSTNLGAQNCSIMMLARDGQSFELRAARSYIEDEGKYYPEGAWPGKRFQPGEGIVGHVVERGEPVSLAEAQDEEDFVEVTGSPVRVRSLMCFPLRLRDETVGVLNLSHSRPGFFSVETEHIVSLLTNRMARLLASHEVHCVRRQSTEQYRLVCETVEDGILVLDQNNRILRSNPAGADLMGQPLEAILDGQTDWMKGILPEDRDRVAAHHRRVITEGCTDIIEYRHQDDGGRVRYLEARCSAVKDPELEGAVVSVLRDVTRRKQAEKERLQLEAQLRHAQKMEAIGELAGGVAHDFNNLLTGIIGNISLARAGSAEVNTDSVLGEAEQAARRAASLVRQLLLLSRKGSSEHSIIDPDTVLDEVMQIARSTFDRGIELEVEKDPALHSVWADPSQLYQVVLNLCVNARDAVLALPDRDALRRIRVSAQNVTVKAEECGDDIEARPGNYVRIAVEDTGVGMDETARQRAFEPFFTTKQEGDGTGLGLAIVYGIVKQHGGWISLHTGPGQGARFEVYLPAAQSGLSSPAPTGEQELRRGKETILLVDDEDMVLRVGRGILEGLGYQVLEARDGLEALEVYARDAQHIDAIILDLSMPRLPGQEVLKRIRAEDPEATIIVSSGYAMPAELTLDPALKPTASLAKPYARIEMADVLQRVLDSK